MENGLGQLATTEQARWERRQKALAEIATWPASQEAERMCRVVGATRLSWMTPALLDLLDWAIEEAPSFNLDPGMAGLILEDLVYRSMFSQKRAVLDLLQVEDPEEEIPAQLLRADTPSEIAAAMLSLADEAADKSPWV